MSRPAAPLFHDFDRIFLQSAVRVGYANPFSPARVEAERAALGHDFTDRDDVNQWKIAERLCRLIGRAHEHLVAGAVVREDDLVLYQEACLYQMRTALGTHLQPVIARSAPPGAVGALFRSFKENHAELLAFPGSPLRPPRPERVFEHAYQLRRAYHHLSTTLIGTSRPMQELRIAVWNAIFTRDLAGYLRTCHTKPSDISILVNGPSGTGKELVAKAIGGSRYEVFDPERGRFGTEEGTSYCAVNLSALSDSLFESELFGHQKGAFTGALKDRKGIFEAVRAGGTVFLDEIGELSADRQVKLLRVLQERVFHRVGDTDEQSFSAQVITATHRDLGQRIKAGEFRLDLYQRLAALRIVTPSLRQQLDAAPGDLALLVWRFAWQLARGEEAAAQVLAADTLRYIEAKLSRYTWPGNVRELLHCVESIHHGGTFTLLELGDDGKPARSSVAPARSSAASPRSFEDWVRSLRLGTLTEQQAIERYRNIVVARTGSISAAARRLGVHRNTVRRSIDPARHARMKARRER